jgi:hypothetical protein
MWGTPTEHAAKCTGSSARFYSRRTTDNYLKCCKVLNGVLAFFTSGIEDVGYVSQAEMS